MGASDNLSSINKIESDEQHSWSRKKFLQVLGLSAAAATGLSRCTEVPNAVDPHPPLQLPPDPRPNNQTIWIGSGDIGLMNTIHIYTRLEAAFYTKVLEKPYNGMSQKERAIITALKNHERAHSDFLSTFLGESAIQNYTYAKTGTRYNFTYFDFNDRAEILRAAFRFENIGVSMYNNFPELFKRTKLTTILAKLGSVEARHATALQFIMDPSANFNNGLIGEDSLDVYNNPQAAWLIFKKYVWRKMDFYDLPNVQYDKQPKL